MPLATSTPGIAASPQTSLCTPDFGLSSCGKRTYATHHEVLRDRRRHQAKANAVEERQLITACRAMDRGAQRRLYDLTVERVYRLILRMVRNDDDALDLTHEVYIRVFTQIDRFRAECSLTTWVHRIAVNEALAFLRRKKTEKRHLNSSNNRDRPQPADIQERDERLDIRAAFDQLSDEDRVILLLRYDQGHDYRSIGELLDCAEGTVASRLSRARNRLKESLTAGYASEEEISSQAHQNDGWQGPRLTRVEPGDRETSEFGTKRHATGGEQP